MVDWEDTKEEIADELEKDEEPSEDVEVEVETGDKK